MTWRACFELALSTAESSSDDDGEGGNDESQSDDDEEWAAKQAKKMSKADKLVGSLSNSTHVIPSFREMATAL
jgi:hypothetical protein